MAIEIINVGGIDYPVQDQQSMALARSAMNEIAYKPHIHGFVGAEERTNYYSVARPANNPFIWYTVDPARGVYTTDYPKNGCLMMTTQAVTKGTQILQGSNCMIITAMDSMAKIRMDRQGNTIFMIDWAGRYTNHGQFAITDTENLYSQKNKFLKTHNVVNGNYDDAQLEVGQKREDYYNQGGRAAIAFHNHSINAVQIYLDGNGDLCYLGNNGSIKKIVLSE